MWAIGNFCFLRSTNKNDLHIEVRQFIKNQATELERKKISTSTQSSSWEELPKELFFEIFKLLTQKDLLTCSLVSRKWNAAANSNEIWNIKGEQSFVNPWVHMKGKVMRVAARMKLNTKQIYVICSQVYSRTGRQS